MTRRNARERAVQFLFQLDFNPGNTDSDLALFWENTGIPDSGARRFAEELIRGVLEHKQSIDARIRNCTDRWEINRMGGVDRNVIRLALFEMLFRPDIPPLVSINEAVDIAKRFGCSESGRFVNGILDRAKKDLEPAEEPEGTPI